jgi:hypothetical protein
MKSRPESRHSKGFALVITLSLMILLTVIAVGLLTLSAISLRASSQGQDMATARSNARLALMLAIGDLQTALGPDRAVSASSEILTATPAKPHTTGVWESWWDFDPGGASLSYTAEKQKRFRRWLVSNADPAALESPGFATAKWSGKTIELVDDNALGGKAAASAKVVAGRVPVARNGKVEGAYAWHVADEAQKARINLYRDPSQNATVAQQRALLAGQRPDPSVMKGADGNLLTCLPADTDAAAFKKATETSAKLTDLDQTELLDKARGMIKPLRHDLTPWSLGVLSDVRGGSLKQDLSSVFEMSSASATTLPAEFSGKKLYQSTHGITGVSDPWWSALAGYYNIFRNITNRDTNPTFYQAPQQDVLLTTLVPPTSYYPGPVIAKVEMVFNFLVRESHNMWIGLLQDQNIQLMGHIMLTPVITLHNPYNVSLSFDRMDMSFKNLPIAFRFYVNDKAQNTKMVPLNALNWDDASSVDRKFSISIANWTSYDLSNTARSGPIVMKPGQTLICQLDLDPYVTFASVSGDYRVNDRDLTGATVKATPGFKGRCYGYDLDVLSPDNYSPPVPEQSDKVFKVLGLKETDRVYLEFQMTMPIYDPACQFQVNASITTNGTTKQYGGLNFKYGDDANLKSLFPKTYRFPASGDFAASEAHVPNTDPMNVYAQAKSVAVFSAYARTCNGGVYETGSRSPTAGSLNALLDGRVAGKPFLFHNPARTVVTMDLKNEKLSSQSHELNLQPLPGNVDNILPVDNLNRSPYLTANTEARGIKSGSYIELPSGPLQTIADFRKSNALTSNYLPHFVQPVANSLVSPLMSTNKVKQTDAAISPNEMLDHSVLANHALYDRFYFSTFATRGSETPDAVFEKFMNRTTPLPSQAFQPYRPGGKTVTDAKAELFAAGKPKNDAYKTAAEDQMIQGPFNVNSTSVQAWKAMLGSLNKSEIVTLWAKNAGLETKQAKGVAILGMSLLNGGSSAVVADAGKIDDAKTNEWNGYHELSDKELQTLAEKIVEQVRARGPFLSMSEFVNRQIGPPSELTRRGALEAALETSGINKNTLKNYETDIAANDISDQTIYKYNTPEIALGSPVAGAPGWISQGDLLRILEPGATVRGDTFVIRVCGEAWDPSGKVTARAYAEAVVQRVPEYVDPVDRPSLNAFTDTKAAKANKTFGRRINLVSFRWLSGNEI